MNQTHRAGIAALLAIFVAVTGCKSKQDKPAEKAAATPAQSGSAAPTAGDTAVSTPDLADARATALRVLAQIEAGDFATVYRESGADFKQIGPEAAFVAKFQQTRQKTGPLGKPRKLKYDTRPDKVIVMLYRVENQRYVSEMRLSFARGKNGAMELVGLNQHDEQRKPAER